LLGPSSKYLRVHTTQGRAFQIPIRREYYPVLIMWQAAPNEALFESGNTRGCNFKLLPPPLIPGILRGVQDKTHIMGCRGYVGMGQTDTVLLGGGTIWRWSYEKIGIVINRPEIFPIIPSAVTGAIIGVVAVWEETKDLRAGGRSRKERI